MKVAVCLLCVQPHEGQALFYSSLSDYGFDVFVLADCNQQAYKVPQRTTLLQVSDDHCIESGYHHFNTVITPKRVCSAWDKAFYFFCKRLTVYDQVWFLEEDVFVPSLAALLSIQTQNPYPDLVCSFTGKLSNAVDKSIHQWRHWSKIPKIINNPPFAHAMCCISRVSRSLLQHIDEFTSAYNQSKPAEIDWFDVERVTAVIGVPFIEIILPMLAYQKNLSVFKSPQLQIKVSRQTRVTKFHKYDLSSLNNNNIFAIANQIYHPIKDVDFQHHLRMEISSLLGDVRAKEALVKTV